MFLCNSVDGVQLPAGAEIDDFDDLLTWTPAVNQVNTDVRFAIATEPDLCGDRATQSWTVHVYAAPVIESFAAARAATSPGESTTLTGVFEGTGEIEGLGPITSGVPIATPVLMTSSNFTLIVTNSAGAEARQTLTIQVLNPPAIQSLSAFPTIITVGGTSTLTWGATGDFSLARLDPLGVDVMNHSSFAVAPAATTMYVLHLSNAAGTSASASVQVEVVAPPVILSVTAAPSSSVLRGTVLLTAQFQNGTGEMERDVGDGSYTTLGPIVSGQAVSSGELLRSTRFRLVVRNGAGTVTWQDLFVPITGPGTFQPTSGQPISPLRSGHTATRLADGRVFIAGDRFDRDSITTEIFDPATGTFAAGPNLRQGRADHAAALLPDGRVLLIGGYPSDATSILDTEIYDPSSGTITSVGPVPGSDLLFFSEAVELLDGRVLVVPSAVGREAAVFDPLTDTFTPVGPLNVLHGCMRVERLADGRALVIDGGSYTPSEIFSSDSDSFALTDVATHARCYFASAVLHDGRVLLAGGTSPSVPAEIYDPATSSFEDVGVQQFYSSNPTANTLATGAVLVVGGLHDDRESPWAELFDPFTGTFAATGGLRDGHRFHTATVLQDGRVLVLGGCRFLPCDAELYSAP